MTSPVNRLVGQIADLGSIGAGAAGQQGRRLPGRSPIEPVEVTIGERTGQLDPADARSRQWFDALSELKANDLPVYLEVDPQTGRITELLVPIVVRVGDLNDTPAGIEVELIISQARHVLNRANPDFDRLHAALAQARIDGSAVLVTETPSTHEIIDVRPPPSGVGPPGRLGPAVAPERDIPFAAVGIDVARRMFTLLNNRTCCSSAPAAPGIPFTFPDDGCWGRAHEMYRLMLESGVRADKVWIYGSLRVNGANKPDCTVRWRWHVAPTLPVATSAGVSTYVLDPALFTEPVPQPTWAGVQGDPNATLVASPGEVFYRDFGGAVSYDPAYSETNTVLARYRAALQARVASDGPPPYVNCMARPSGVQWFGTVEGGANRRWFTFGWPASWHVLWTVMPISICQGAPQLSWSVAVERADSGRCTYWITVKNLTTRPVRFEGRYDILAR